MKIFIFITNLYQTDDYQVKSQIMFKDYLLSLFIEYFEDHIVLKYYLVNHLTF